MVFTKRLRDGVRRGRIRCSVRIWQRLHVKVGGRYPMDDGHIVVDSIAAIEMADITDELARESGFSSAEDLLETASHGPGTNVYLIRFHYLPPGAWDATRESRAAARMGRHCCNASAAVRRRRYAGRAKTARQQAAPPAQGLRNAYPGAAPCVAT